MAVAGGCHGMEAMKPHLGSWLHLSCLLLLLLPSWCAGAALRSPHVHPNTHNATAANAEQTTNKDNKRYGYDFSFLDFGFNIDFQSRDSEESMESLERPDMIEPKGVREVEPVPTPPPNCNKEAVPVGSRSHLAAIGLLLGSAFLMSLLACVVCCMVRVFPPGADSEDTQGPSVLFVVLEPRQETDQKVARYPDVPPAYADVMSEDDEPPPAYSVAVAWEEHQGQYWV